MNPPVQNSNVLHMLCVILVQISEQEWLDTAYAANKPNASIMHKFGMMTGWKDTVNSEQIYKKMSQATEYTLP